MADVSNIVTLGIGATPGGRIWYLTSGLESGAVTILEPGTRKVWKAGDRPNVLAAKRHTAEARVRENVRGEG